MNASSKIREALKIKAPCDLIFEYNEKNEVVVRLNKKRR